MGAIGSKEKLSQIVVIYGHNYQCFPWKNQTDRDIYHASGLIISVADKKYILTTRTNLIACKNLVMYHSYFNDAETILRNNLSIIFQSIEYNIMLLVTNGKTELDLNCSEVISGEIAENSICNSHDILNIGMNKPTTRSQYYMAIVDINLKNDAIQQNVEIYNAKFLKDIIYDKTFLPANYFYKYKLFTKDDDTIYGVYGAAIFNKKLKLMGIVTHQENGMIYVLPVKMIQKIVRDFVTFKQDPKTYIPFRRLPIDYKISNKTSQFKITNVYDHDKKLFKENDKIISIDGNPIKFLETAKKKLNTIPIIHDIELNVEIPLDVYLNLNLKANTNSKIIIDNKDGGIQEISVNNIPYVPNPFKFTAQPYFYPGNIIPYVNFRELIIVELTHELIHILFMHNIKIKNHIVDAYFADKKMDYGKYFLILDCLDQTLSQKLDLPYISFQKKLTINCPTIISVNEKNFDNLDDFKNIPENKCVFKIKTMNSIQEFCI